MIRGSKTEIELLDSDWNKIQTQTGWKLQPLLSSSTYISAVPVATNLDRSTAPPIVPVNNGSTTTANNLLPATAPVLDLSAYTPVTPQVCPTSSSTNNTTVLESTDASRPGTCTVSLSSADHGAAATASNP